MDAWPSTPVPDLPGHGLPLRLHDTATGEVRETSARGTGRMYVCGITPYDATHLGHAATYLAFDLVQRVWRDAGLDVHYVQNVTDVDDPLLERAAHTGENWMSLAEREIQLFREDMTALRVLPPRRLHRRGRGDPGDHRRPSSGCGEQGNAYAVDEDVYFPVSSAPRFGHESNLDRETMLALFGERGGDPNRAGKRDPLDSLLWRGRRWGEPYWDTELGPGRPGWHIECSVIALNRLGMGFDVQGGGSDLAFPHHEHSAAHAEVLTGEPAVRAPLRARRHDRARRREDEQVARQPRPRLASCAGRTSTRWRSGWRCSTGTTAPTASGPAAGCPTPRPG